MTSTKDAILAALTEGPKITPEIRTITGAGGNTLANAMKTLLREGEISRIELSKGRYRYYIGQTSGEAYQPIKANLIKTTTYSQPVKVINIARGYFGEAQPIRITLPAAPWEVGA